MAGSRVQSIFQQASTPASVALRACGNAPASGKRLAATTVSAPMMLTPSTASRNARRGFSNLHAAGFSHVLPGYFADYPSAYSLVEAAFRQSRLEKERCREKLEAELFHFKHVLKPRKVTLQQIREFREEETLRHFLVEELPIRYAQRLQLIESLPGWAESDLMRQIHDVYEDAFKRVRNVDMTSLYLFRNTLRTIKRRTSSVMPSLVQGVRGMHLDLGEECANRFLDTFMSLRISTDILTSQYLSITRTEHPTSVVQPECNVASIVQRAAEDASRLCRFHYCHAPEVDVEIAGQVSFPCVSQFLDYIMFELLKNSTRAVVEKYGASCSSHPIKVVVLGDETSISVKISDQGVGINADQMDKVWSYLWTTAKPQVINRTSAAKTKCQASVSMEEEGIKPMAGFGCGLPLSRCYADYVGGSVFLHSKPHCGTDAYVCLKRGANPVPQNFWSRYEAMHP